MTLPFPSIRQIPDTRVASHSQVANPASDAWPQAATWGSACTPLCSTDCRCVLVTQSYLQNRCSWPFMTTPTRSMELLLCSVAERWHSWHCSSKSHGRSPVLIAAPSPGALPLAVASLLLFAVLASLRFMMTQAGVQCLSVRVPSRL